MNRDEFNRLWERSIIADRAAHFIEAAREAKAERLQAGAMSRDEYRQMVDDQDAAENQQQNEEQEQNQ